MNGGAHHPGGCLCGAIRYRVDGAITEAAHCHCSMCRRAAGAPAVTWFWVDRARFHLTHGTLATYRSSAQGERGFCGRCGTPITFSHDSAPDSVDITLCSLDNPESVAPTHHVWTSSRIAWLHLNEQLPGSPRGGPPADEH